MQPLTFLCRHPVDQKATLQHMFEPRSVNDLNNKSYKTDGLYLYVQQFWTGVVNVIVISQHKTGLPISTYFSAVKLRWLMDNVSEVHEAVVSHRAMFGTVDAWLIWVRS